MFERFTDRARRVVVLAQEEAGLLNHDYIGTEHILLGLIRETEGIGGQALRSLGMRLDSVRSQVVETIGRGHRSRSGYISFTRRAKTVLELSLREALQLGHDYIDTEHVLLGLIREGDGVAAQVLEELGADLPEIRRAVVRLLAGGASEDPPERGPVRARGPDDSITLKGLRIPARHGVTDEERASGQTFFVDVVARLDLSAAGCTDDLSETLDYGILAEAIHRRVSGEQWNLIEKVAERVADLVLENGLVTRVEVTVHKPEAPIRVPFEDVAVTIVRHSPGA
ncbi:MAG: dihydroneopterin aldolase [bacterium]|nr:dihydroneopterin aldolase [bacterium]MDE0437770.1 dihydroneopterin aldolase [bacterium]